jgi:hypothetical protein
MGAHCRRGQARDVLAQLPGDLDEFHALFILERNRRLAHVDVERETFLDIESDAG